MSDTFNSQLLELASRAGDSAALDEASAVRRRGTRRTLRRRGSAALLGGGAVAVTVGLAVTLTGNDTAGQKQLVATTTPPRPSASPTSAATTRAHHAQIEAQVAQAASFSVGDSHFAVITKATAYAYQAEFYATPDSQSDVAVFGATWVQVVAANLEHGFSHVTIKREPSSSLPTDAIIDVQNSAGQSVLGQRIPLSTPLVLIAAS